METEKDLDFMRMELEHWQKDLEKESPTLNLLEAAHINSLGLEKEEVARLHSVMHKALHIIQAPAENLPILADPAYLAVWALLSSAIVQDQLHHSYKAVSFVCNFARRSKDENIRNRAEKLWDELLIGYKKHLSVAA
jgi:hypothetical protein